MTTTHEFDPEFNATYLMTDNGNVFEWNNDGLPEATHDEQDDVLLDGYQSWNDPEAEWRGLSGFTGQYGYHGPVMHPSELWGEWAMNALASQAQGGAVVFGITEVIDPDDEDSDPVGWIVLYRVIEPTEHEWHRSRLSGALTCDTCGLFPVDDDDVQSSCPGFILSYRKQLA